LNNLNLHPPQELLDFISFEEFYLTISMPSFSPKKEELYYIPVIESIVTMVQRYYRFRYEQETDDRIGWFYQIFVVGLHEAVKNASFHGNQEDYQKQVIFAVWFGRKGMIYGVRDEGDFYSLQFNKEKVETRQVIPSQKDDIPHPGMKCIYDADKLYVDVEQNTLFVAVLLDELADRRS